MVLALLSTVGLLSALLGDGIWDVLSWLALATPVFVIVRHSLRHLRSRENFERDEEGERSKCGL